MKAENPIVQKACAVLFEALYLLGHIVMVPLLVLFVFLPTNIYMSGLRLVFRVFGWLERNILGLTYEVRGREHLSSFGQYGATGYGDAGCYIFACQHQSQWETYKLHIWLGDPAIIMKKELAQMPLWGWIARRVRVLPVDRQGRRAAIDSLVAGGRKNKAMGRPITIFPEGTRTPPGVRRPYKVGVSALYEALEVPIVPVALNSGLYWPKKLFGQRGGKIIVEILPPILPGLSAADALTELQRRMTAAGDRLVAEARAARP